MTNDQDVPAGWYGGGRSRDRERYWDGSAWGNGDRWRRSKTPDFPGSGDVPAWRVQTVGGPPRDPQPRSPWAVFIAVLAVLFAIGTLVSGIVLISHTGRSCDPDCTTTHPRGAAGAALIVGGLLEAAFVGSFAALHQETRTLRIQVAVLSDRILGGE